MKKNTNYIIENNPFESGHIKNYIFLYLSVVVIMILFFLAAHLFHEEKIIDQKVFKVTKQEIGLEKIKEIVKEKENIFKLMPKAY